VAPSPVPAQKRPAIISPSPPPAKQPKTGEDASAREDAGERAEDEQTADQMRETIQQCGTTFEESIDMWWMQDLMKDVVQKYLDEAKVENLTLRFHWQSCMG